MSNVGMKRLLKAALQAERDQACSGCGSDDLRPLGRRAEMDQYGLWCGIYGSPSHGGWDRDPMDGAQKPRAEFGVLAAREGMVKCGGCGIIQRSEDARNYLREALSIYEGKTMLIAGAEHINALVGHCEELHLKVAELEEVLAAERGRMAAARHEEPQYA